MIIRLLGEVRALAIRHCFRAMFLRDLCFWQSGQDCQPKGYFLEVGFLQERRSWEPLLLWVIKYVPSLDLCAFHDSRSWADMGIVIDNGVGDGARMFNSDVVANSGWQRESLIRDPESWLNCWVVSYFSVGAYSNRVVKAIYNCTKAHVTVRGHDYIAVDCSVRCNMDWRCQDKSAILDVEDVAVSIDGFEVGDIMGELGTFSIER